LNNEYKRKTGLSKLTDNPVFSLAIKNVKIYFISLFINKMVNFISRKAM